MKKNIAYFILLIFIAGYLSSCKKVVDTENVSTITYYPKFEFSGDDVMLLALNSTYIEPGVVAKENGVEIPLTISVVGEGSSYKGTTIPMDVADKYTITYEAKNSDGFSGTVTRDVWVFETEDLTSGLAGLFTSTVQRGSAPVTSQYTDLEYIIISKLTGADYKISCAIGGYYSIGRAYGADYNAIGGKITVNDIASNNFAFTQFVIPGFGNTVDITSIEVNAGTKTIVVHSAGNFANSVFHATLTQVQL